MKQIFKKIIDLKYFLFIYFIIAMNVFISHAIASSRVDKNTDQPQHNVYLQTPIDKLQKLFISQQLRQVLQTHRDEYEEGKEGKKINLVVPNSSPPSIPKSQAVLQMKGLILRKDGKHTVWINDGNTFLGYDADQDISIELDYIKQQKLLVPVNVSNKKVHLKPGQVWEEENNSLTEQFNK